MKDVSGLFRFYGNYNLENTYLEDRYDGKTCDLHKQNIREHLSENRIPVWYLPHD